MNTVVDASPAMWNPADVGFLWIAFLVTGGVLLVLAHVRATGAQPQADLRAALELLAEKTTKHVNLSPDFQRCFNEELLEARQVMLKNFSSALIHFAFLLCLTMAWMFLQEPSFSSVCNFLASLFAYAWFFLAPEMAKTESQFRNVAALLMCIHALFVIGLTYARDLALFDVGEKIATINTVIMSLALIDFKMTIPFYVCQSAALTHCRWSLIGVAQITPFMIFVPFVSYAIVGAISALSVLYIQSRIAAKLDSDEVASLMLGFRQILRGVCDGELILDRRTMTIVDDAICLERVLKSERKLSNSNFLDLFLDSESREKFSDFLQAEYLSQSSMPRGLRVSLQGAGGPVSMDLFCTALPQRGASSDYCLLAMKEDPVEQLQTAPPEAPPYSAPERIRQPERIQPEKSRSRSSTSERVVAYDDLSEIALLVSDATGLMDIEQVHLSFQRKSKVCNIESGMPTLRRFIRPADWDRIERMFSIVTNLQAPDQHERCYFRRPTFFRVPGESRKYLCARHTSLRLAGESVAPGRPTHFWMHLGEFDLSNIGRLWEGQLEHIEEEQ